MSKGGKTKVDFASGAPRPSKIRREPPARPAALKPTVLPDAAEREAWTVAIGVVLFGLAITIIIFGVGNYFSR